MSFPTACDVVVVGGGLAGLNAARDLVLAGLDVQLIERSDSIGGRVRTDVVDGMRLDRGFQLYNPWYPEGRRVLDHIALDLRPLAAGITVSLDGRMHHLANPLRQPGWAIDSLVTPLAPLRKKLAFAAYALRAQSSNDGRPDERAGAFLERHFGKSLTQSTLRPFFAGVFLDEELDTSRRFLDEVVHSFVRGVPAVPAEGMQRIPEQIAAQVGTHRIHTGVRATAATGTSVTTDSGVISCRAVIVATDAHAAGALVAGVPAPIARSVTTWYHLADVPGAELTKGFGTVVVDGLKFTGTTEDRPLINSVVLSNAAPEYAPGRTLISSSAVGVHLGNDVEKRVRAHLQTMYGVSTSHWELVATYPIEHALPAALAPHVATDSRIGGGMYVAGDYRQGSSINGALASGRIAAAQLREDLR